MYYLYYKKTCVQFYYNSTYLFTKINHKATFHSYSNSYCNTKITFAIFLWFRISRQSLRGEHRRLSGQPLSKWRHLHGPSKRVFLSVSAGLHGHAMRAGRGWMLCTAVLMSQWRYMHKFAWQLFVYMRERLDWAWL